MGRGAARDGASRERAAQRRRLERALAAVESELIEAEAEVARLTRELARPALYEDRTLAEATAREHASVKDRAASLMARWEEAGLALERASAAEGGRTD